MVSVKVNRAGMVYVAGALRSGDRPIEMNINRAIEIGIMLIMNQQTPYIPHLNFFANLLHPLPEQYWIKLNREMLGYCKALVLCSDVTGHVEEEIAWAKDIGIPIYHHISAFLSSPDQIAF